MVKDIYNIYMTFPSDVKTIKVDKKDKKAIDCSVSRVQGLELRDEFGEILTTSETAIKYLFKKKIEEEQDVDFTLDRIFLLVSDTVAEKIGFVSDITKKRPLFDVNTTHLDVLCHQIDHFYEAYFNKKITPSFSEIKKVIPCGDSLDNTKQLGDNIIKLCEQIIEYKSELPLDSKIKLYIDTSGGFRNAAMLFLIVGRIMSYMGIEVANIYYTSWVEGVCTVHEIKDTYDLLDLIAGFEEFLMFGSAKKLNDHYRVNESNLQITQETSNQKSIDELLKAMNQFSDVINISRRGEFKTELSILNQKLSQIHFDYDSSVEGFNYQLIKLLREPIEKEYTSLFKQKSLDTMDELSYVEWCLKHDYIQQALTLFKECVPDFLIKKGVIVVDQAKFCNYIKNKKLKADMNILETALNKWNAMHPERHSDNLFKLDEFLNVYTDGVEPVEDVRDDADLVFNEINEYRTLFIAKYTNRDALFKKLSAIVKAYVAEAQNKEFITNKDY
ncbi:MAG: TM1812 family CRISPR-associated protein, partial [Veillonella sp.]|nr:TM1812 family CRISPR-associated protein [Veillonella sp.]